MTDELETNEELDKTIDELLELTKMELAEMMSIGFNNGNELHSVIKLMSMLHSLAHEFGWKTDGTCGNFDRMMMIMTVIGQRVAGNGKSNKAVGAGNLMSHDSMKYVLSGWGEQPKDYYGKLPPSEQLCLHKIAEFSVTQKMQDMMSEQQERLKEEGLSAMAQPIAMDGDALFEIVMNCAVMVYQVGRHGQNAHALDTSFTLTEEET